MKRLHWTKVRKIKIEMIKTGSIAILLLAYFVLIGQYMNAPIPVSAGVTWKAYKSLPKNEYKDDLSVEQKIRRIALEQNFPYTDYLLRLSFCESSWNPKANGDNGNSWGLYQIHLGYHPEITPEQAMDIQWSTEWTMDKILSGNQNLWSCNSKIKGKTLSQLK